MKKLLLALLLPALALGQTGIQKGAGNVLSNGPIVVGNGNSITATGSGAITATGVSSSFTVPYLQVASVPTARLLGRTTAGTGAAEAISVGTSLALSAGSLNAVQDIRTSATPTFAGVNANALTSLASTNLVLTGNGGASLTLGQGGSGIITASFPSSTGGYIDLGTGPTGDNYFPLRWGTGSRFSIVGTQSTFQSVADNSGGIQYNPGWLTNDVAMGISFENRFQNTPNGVASEFYIHWDGVLAAGSGPRNGPGARRPFQINTSWGTSYGDPHAAGFTDASFYVERFSVSPLGLFGGTGNCLYLDFTASPYILYWTGNVSVAAGSVKVDTEGGSITMDGAGFSRLGLVKKTGTDPTIAIGSATALSFSRSNSVNLYGNVDSSTFTVMGQFLASNRLSLASGLTSVAGADLSIFTEDSNKNIVLSPHNGSAGVTGGYVLLPVPPNGAGLSGSNAALRWGAGSKYSLGAAQTTFNSVNDNAGGIFYNMQETAADVKFGVGFEARFHNPPTGSATEFYYAWSGVQPAQTGSKRPLQINTSWGTSYGDPDPAGYTWTTFHSEKFSISGGGGFTATDGLHYVYGVGGTSTLAFQGAFSTYTAAVAGALTSDTSTSGQFTANYPGSGNGTPAMFFIPALGTAPNYASIYIGKAITGYGSASLSWENNANGTSANNFYLGFAGVANYLKMWGTGVIEALATTEATTSTAALVSDGGVLSKKKIVGLSTLSTLAGVAYDFGAASGTTITSPDKSLKLTVAGTDYYVPAKLTNN